MKLTYSVFGIFIPRSACGFVMTTNRRYPHSQNQSKPPLYRSHFVTHRPRMTHFFFGQIVELINTYAFQMRRILKKQQQ